MSDTPYKVKLTGQGLSLERDVSKEVGEQVAVLILTGSGGGDDAGRGRRMGTDLTGKERSGRGHHEHGTSPREFLDDSEPKRSPDKIAALGVYLKDHRGKDSFTAADVEGLFESAGESVPKNLPRDMKWAVKAGWIAPRGGEKGAFYVTNNGRKAVTQKFPPDLVKKTGFAARKKRAGKKTTKA